MQYQMALNNFSAPPSIEISEQHFKEIEFAKNGLIAVSLIEELFSAVLENYLEFEIDLLEVSARYLVLRPDFEPSIFQNDRERFNRRLMNLLSACRSYIDQSKHYISGLVGRGQTFDAVIKARSAQYDSILGYRAMELLRNYVQHQGFPIHGMSYANSWENSEERRKAKMRIVVSVRLKIEELRSDPEHQKPSKRKILDELPHKQGMCDLRPLIREYITSLSVAHKVLRDEMNAYVLAWDSAYQGAEMLAATTWPQESLVTLEVCELDDTNQRARWVRLPNTVRERCKELVSRPIPHESLSRCFVSNEA